ncbi:hypothetical protein AAEX28_15505 [Lentisphaerota bacterium WC36G]|nr:hypothetical protein LJT99_02260 [Lentisphaerae bacterium WC36]
MKKLIPLFILVNSLFLVLLTNCQNQDQQHTVKKSDFLDVSKLKEISRVDFYNKIKNADRAVFVLMKVKTPSKGKFLLNKQGLVHKQWVHSRTPVKTSIFKRAKKLILNNTVESVYLSDHWFNMYAFEFYQENKFIFTVFVDFYSSELYCYDSRTKIHLNPKKGSVLNFLINGYCFPSIDPKASEQLDKLRWN